MEIRQIKPQPNPKSPPPANPEPEGDPDLIELYEPSARENAYFDRFLVGENYQNFMLDLELGASLTGVCAKYGLGSHTVKRWFNSRGEGYDKFRKDYLISIGDAFVLAEQALHQKNPQYYLTRGAGKYIPDNIHLEPEVQNTRIEDKEEEQFKVVNSERKGRVSDLAHKYLPKPPEK